MSGGAPYSRSMDTTVIGRAKLDGETVPCDHCGRQIKNLVHISNGQTVGTSCALTKMGYSRTSVDGAPFVISSLEELSRVGGFFVFVMIGGQVRRAVRGCLPGGGYSDWRLA